MKKFISCLVLIFLISLCLTGTVFSQQITVDIAGKKSTYNGNVYNFELNGVWIPTQTPCIVISNVAYVPLREIFQNYLGMTVGYDGGTQTAYVQNGSKRMDFSISKQAIYKNGVKVDTNLPVATVNGNTMVPLSLTAGYFGLTVSVKNNKTLAVQWNNSSGNTSAVKEAKLTGNVSRITYYNENGKEIVFVETGAAKIIKHYVISPVENNPCYRLCIQFSDAHVDRPGSFDVNTGSVRQIRYAQADTGNKIVSLVIETGQNPQYSVDTVSGGIKITIQTSASKPSGTQATPTPAPAKTTVTPAPSPSPTPVPAATPAPSPSPKPSPAPVKVTPTPTPAPAVNEAGTGALRYTVEDDRVIVWLDGVNLEKEIRNNPGKYSVEYRNIEKILQIKMPLNNNFKTEVLPGNSILYGIISSVSKTYNEITIRISGKDDFNWTLASNGSTGTKIVITKSNGPVVTPTPAAKPVSPTPTPAQTKNTVTPTPTPRPSTATPTPAPSTGSLINRGGSGRTGTVSYIAGTDRIIIDAAALKNYKIFRLTNPSRIVIDLYNNVIESKETTAASGSLYTRIRTGQFDSTTARIVLEIPDNINYETTTSGNRLTIKLSNSGTKNISLQGDVGSFSIKITGKGIKEKIEQNREDIIVEDDSSSNTFTFLFPHGIVDLGSGMLEVGDSIMESVQTLTSGNSAFLSIKLNKSGIQYNIRYTTSNDEVLIEPIAGNSKNTGSGSGTQTGGKSDTGTETKLNPAYSGKLVVLDAGHGGSDPGATYGNDEKWYNLDITLRLEKLLKEKGVNVKLTRSADVFVGLDERAEMANEWGAWLFVSIHNNALMKAMHGTMTFYYPTSSKGREYATIIHNDMVKNLGSNDLGIRTAKFVVLKKTKMPAVLVEVGCLTNDEELAKLNTEEYRQKAAESLCESILKIISQ